MPSVDERIQGGVYALWGHVFQGANTTWLFTDQIRNGNFFNGLQASSSMMWDAQIPKNAVINSASIEVTARLNSNANAYTLPLNTTDRDTYQNEPLILPFSTWTGFRRDYWSDAAMGALSTTFTAIAGSATAPSNSSWIVRQLLGWRDRMVQFTPTRTGNMTLAFGIWELHRTGNPLGNCRMRIQGVTLDSFGFRQPDGIDVAVSDDVLCSSIALGPAATTTAFNFSGGETLVALTEYAWILEVDYTPNNADHISSHHHNAFFNVGDLYHEGTGIGGDWQNYPGTVDWTLAQAPSLVADVVWNTPQFIAGTTYATPDISTLVQAQVNQPWYVQDSGILITQPSPAAGLNNRVWRPFFGATLAQRPRLLVDYSDPVTGNREQRKIYLSASHGFGYHRR